MKILLISPNTLIVPYPVYPLGLDYVAGSISPDHEVRIADMNILSLEALEKLLQEFPPAIIGLSCRNIDNTDASDSQFFINTYRKLVRWLRARTGAVLVCGGSGFTIMPERVFASLAVDYGIVGEGERFGKLVDALATGKAPEGIPGVVTALSFPVPPEPWTGAQVRGFESHAPHVSFYLKKGGMLNLQTKRGCSFNCIYCPYPRIEGKKHRLVPPGEVARTAMDLQAAGARYLFVTDSAFNSDVAHSLAVAKAFKAAGLAIPWGGFFAPLALPVDYFSIMADAGLKHVEFGTESMSATMLATYRKPFAIKDVFAAHNQAQAAGLHVAHYFLFGGPGESPATIAESLDNIEGLARAALFFFIGIRIYPHTVLHEIARDEGKITGETDMLEPIFYISDDIGRDDIEAMVAARGGKRANWIIGSGGAKSAPTISKMHERGHAGPLWELLAR